MEKVTEEHLGNFEWSEKDFQLFCNTPSYIGNKQGLEYQCKNSSKQ